MEYPKLITPVEGVVYHNRSGFDCRCESCRDSMTALMVRIPDGWTCLAHGVRQYEDGTIEWDWSSGGHWLH